MAAQSTLDHLVVIGASAGGVEALSTLVSTLPRDFSAPIVIAQHLDPQHPSYLGDILARRSTLPVRVVTDSAPLEPGVVYVVPANRHVEIAAHDVQVRTEGAGRSKPSIDLLLSSAARVYGEGLIAVILTGTGADGTVGARAVKKAGGTVVIQNPQTALFPAMPRALAPTTVDIVADIGKMGPLLHDLLNGIYMPAPPEEDKTLHAFLDDVRARSGIDFTPYKMPTILRRLARRIAATGTATLAGYIAYLRDYPEEYQRLIGSFLIKVTEFFRDPAVFDYLRTQVLPEVIARARTNGNELRLWSAGCATGEEAYSLAILVADILGEELEQFSVRIFATDLDAEAIAFARRGVYPAAALAALPADLIARSFSKVNGAYTVTKRVRGLIVFGQHDLSQEEPFLHIDLVLCRNVLIYFTTELQIRALRVFAFSLRDNGYLVLGQAETTSALSAPFAPVDAPLKIYRRQVGVARGGGLLSLPPRVGTRPSQAPRPAGIRPRRARGRRRSSRPWLSGETSFGLLAGLPVGVVAVNRSYAVQAINTTAQRLLGIHTAALGQDLLHLVQHVPAAPLRTAIDAALAGAALSSVDEVASADPITGEEKFLQILCSPGAPGVPVAAVVILVLDITRTVHERQAQEQEGADQRAEALHRQARQQEEATRLMKQVQHVIESNTQLLAANKDLNKTIKGLQRDRDTSLARMEEVQASSEEVETLYEELQATNEELETLNEELQATIEELRTTNDDVNARRTELQELSVALEAERARLEVIVNSIGDAVVVVDRAGTTVLANAAYDQLFGSPNAPLRLHDERGQPLEPDAWPQQRATRGETFSMQFTLFSTDSGETGPTRWFEANGQPVRNGSEHDVVVIRDISVPGLHRRLQDEFLVLASHELRTPLTAARAALDLLGPSARDRLLPDEGALLDNARRNIERLSLLIADLLAVTQIEGGTLQLVRVPLDVRTVVTAALSAVRPLIEQKGQTVEVDLPTPLVTEGDAWQLEHVAVNLLANAHQHTPGGTHIVIAGHVAGDEVLLTVHDTGPGIPMKDQEHIFERFYRGATGGDGPGLGLGLAIARGIVALHGGRMWAESSRGVGTTFSVALPRSRGEGTS
ncbi:MAG TPA: chemotaxis protein CheB [Chloroflexota bacterium]|nr:chemotaxis protein CheB [Chloroflexota bacterium]